MNEKIYFTFLHSIGFSQAELLQVFGETKLSPKDVYENISDLYLESLGILPARRKIILQGKEKFLKNNGEEKNTKVLENLSVNLITYRDEIYPESLRHISHSPFLLYVRGNIPQKDMFGAVGSRKISTYGKKVMDMILPEITQHFVIVSGGAAGCDTYAHKIALQNNKKTVSVIGTGIDENYPVMNQKLYDEIAQNGAVISIFRIGEPGNPYNFPVRNEIVVGLSRGILVVEAAEKSGSLITANLALDLGKDLFAVPGDISHTSSLGCNTLIKKGSAKLVSQASDILEEYDGVVKSTKHEEIIPNLNTEEMQIYSLLQQSEYDISDLVDKLKVSVQKLSITLSLLEIKGIIKKDLSGKYRLR